MDSLASGWALGLLRMLERFCQYAAAIMGHKNYGPWSAL
jgi:hypothetical protein